jgi:GT2 family glycosyltransferase
MAEMIGSIIIPTKDKTSRLKLVLQALESQVGSDIEVIVVFDGCEENTLEEFQKITFCFEPVLIISQQNIGRAAARNLGISRASGKIIIFLDDDRIPAPDLVEKHMEKHYTDIVVLGKRKELFYTEEEILLLSQNDTVRKNFSAIIKHATSEVTASPLLHKVVTLHPKSPLRWVPFFTGNVSVAKQDLERVGMFDPEYCGWGFEDVDLGYRLYQVGLPFIYDTTIVNYHLSHRNGMKQLQAEARRNQDYFYSKYKSDLLVRVIFLLYRIVKMMKNIKIFANKFFHQKYFRQQHFEQSQKR